MKYSFRIRFKLPDDRRIGIDSEKWPLTPVGSSPEITLCSKKKGFPIKDAEELVLRGNGYSSEEEARIAGEQARDAATLAFARLHIGADFGNFAPKSCFTNAGLQMLEKQTGTRILNDVHGLMTFETDPPPQFATSEVNAILTKGPEKFIQAFRLSFELQVTLKPEERLSLDLFSRSFFELSPDARLVMLIMAVETLLKPEPRFCAAKQHVDELIRLTNESTMLPKGEKNSLLGSLQELRKESIGQAGRKLAKKLGDRKYLDRSAEDFFTYCYSLRSKLVHGKKRPPREKVAEAVVNLESFVGDLLSGPLLQQVTL